MGPPPFNQRSRCRSVLLDAGDLGLEPGHLNGVRELRTVGSESPKRRANWKLAQVTIVFGTFGVSSFFRRWPTPPTT